MNGQTAAVLGATGLIGSRLVEELIRDEEYKKIIVITRRPYEFKHARIVNNVVNFERPEELSNVFGDAQVIFCSVGTTQKKVKGDEAAYRKIDFDIPVNAARIGLEKGVKQYILVSSVGADPSSRSFYLRLKGEVENAISAMGYESVYLLRPSILLGKRNEFRIAESIGKAVMSFASALLFGSLRKYHSTKADLVAHAMVAAGKEKKPGVHILHYDEMLKY